MSKRTFLAFRTATWRLALPLEDVRRVIPLPLLQAPLGAPSFVEGFLDFHGDPVAVLRLDRLFAVDEGELGIYSPLILLDVDAPAVALHVGQIDGILECPEGHVQPIGREETFNSCIIGRIDDRGESVYLLSPDEVLLSQERMMIAAYGARMQQRLAELADSASP